MKTVAPPVTFTDSKQIKGQDSIFSIAFLVNGKHIVRKETFDVGKCKMAQRSGCGPLGTTGSEEVALVLEFSD